MEVNENVNRFDGMLRELDQEYHNLRCKLFTIYCALFIFIICRRFLDFIISCGREYINVSCL